MKKLFALFAAFCLVLNTAACSDSSQKNEQQEVQETTLEITDDAGRTVTVPVKPESVSVLTGSYADEWRLAGGESSLKSAAHDAFTAFGLPEDGSIQDLGEIKEPNVELLLASEPQLVIGSAKNQSHIELADQLAEAGIPMLLFDVSTFDEYLNSLKIMTDITGDSEAYQKYGLDQQKEIEEIIEKAPEQGPTVLYLRAAGSKVKAMNSENNVLGPMLKDLNTDNIGDTGSPLSENLSMETIVEEDPEVIFLVLQGTDSTKARKAMEEQITSNPAWSSLSAVQNNRVYTLDQNLFNLKPNARWAEAYDTLEKILYEEDQTQ